MFNNVIEEYSEILTRFRQETGQANAVLAGGCLRDTFYGVEVKDLDFIIECPRGVDGFYRYPIGPVHRSLDVLWPDKEFRYVNTDNYDGLPREGEHAIGIGGDSPAGLLDVIESTDKKINIIMVKSIPQYTQQFPDSISQMVLDERGVHTSSRWMDGHNGTAVHYRWDIKTPRLMKLKTKYPTWEFIPEAW